MKKLTALTTTVLLAALVCVSGCATNPHRDMTLDWRDIDYSAINGANYVPTYANNDVVTWDQFDPEVIDRELGYAEKAGINSVRVFLQIIVYEKDPKQFMKNFETFLQLCDKHNITMMPVLFDSCFGKDPDFESYGWVANPGNKRVSQTEWPGCEKYIEDVVGSHVGDRRILLWDVMNEPMVAGTFTHSEEGREIVWRFLNHFIDRVNEIDPTHATSAGFASVRCFDAAGKNCRVLNFHSYFGGEENHRKDIATAKAWAKEHGDRPIIISEMAHFLLDQPMPMTIDVCREEGIGFYIWELMIGRDPFPQVQGVFYPDGTIRYPSEFASLKGLTIRPHINGVISNWGWPNEEALSRLKEASSCPTADWNFQRRLELLNCGTIPRILGQHAVKDRGLHGEDKEWAIIAESREIASEIIPRIHEVRKVYMTGDVKGAYTKTDEAIAYLAKRLAQSK